MILLNQIYDPPTNRYKKELSEEIKLEIFKCVELSSRNLSNEAVEQLMIKNNRMFISQCIFVCKEAIESEKFLKLRILAVEALLGLTQIHDNFDHTDLVLREQISKVLFIVLPKVSNVLIKVCQEDTLRGPHLIKIALKTLGRFLCLILEDYEKKSLNTYYSNEEFMKLLNVTKKTEEISSKKLKIEGDMEINSEWMSVTSQNLSKLIPNLTPLRVSQYRDIRYELVVFSFNLLNKCLVNVQNFSKCLIENLIACSEDEDEKVKNYCLNSLKSLNFYHEISELFTNHLIEMPRIIMTGLENEQISGLKLLKSYLNIDHKLLDNPPILEMFINILLNCCEINTSHDLVLFETTNSKHDLSDDYYQLKKPWRKFKNFKSDAAESKFFEICQILGKSEISYTCLNYILDRINSLEHLILIIAIIEFNSTLTKSAISNVIEEFLNESYWDMEVKLKERKVVKNPREEWYKDNTPGLYESAIQVKLTDLKLDEDNNEREERDINLKTIRYNVLCACFVTELIGIAAIQLGKDFQPFILSSINKILEKAGNSNFLIKSAGIYSIKCITEAMGHSNVCDLINQHSDFLLFNIRNKLRRNFQNEAFLDMISVIFNFSQSSVASYMEEIIETAADHLTNDGFKINSCAYLKLFNLYAISIKNDDGIDEEEVEREAEKRINELNTINEEEIEEKLKDLNENLIEEEEEEIKPQIPLFIQLLLKILNSSLPFFASSDQSEVILVHEIFENSLKTLYKFDDKNFLPTIHQMWYPFTKQFQGSNFVILQHSFRLLTLITSLAKDFIYQKSEKILLVLNKFLTTTRSHMNVTYSQEFKLQREILSGYGQLAIDLGIENKKLDDIINVLLRYKNHQNDQLAVACENSIKALRQHDPMLMKFKLLEF